MSRNDMLIYTFADKFTLANFFHMIDVSIMYIIGGKGATDQKISYTRVSIRVSVIFYVGSIPVLVLYIIYSLA